MGGSANFVFTLVNSGVVQGLPATFQGLPVEENGTDMLAGADAILVPGGFG